MQIYHIKCMWVSDLHFMVQWFCLMSWRLFDGWMLYWRYWFSATLILTYKYICRSVTYICDAVILPYIWWTSLILWILVLIWAIDLYKYICRIVTYILWYSDSALYFHYYLMNKPHSLDIGSDMGHWPVFHDLAILNHLPISAFSSLLKFDMKIFVNVARLVYSRHEAGASVYLGHISSFFTLIHEFNFHLSVLDWRLWNKWLRTEVSYDAKREELIFYSENCVL